MADLQQIVADLRAESDELDALVAPLPDDRWAAPTPAAGWTIAHQIGHLLWTDRGALIAVTDEQAFAGLLEPAAANPTGFVNAGADELAATAPAELLADWRLTRERLHDALLTVPDGRKLPWFGPPMSAASMATARLMETWAHGLDVADTLGVSHTSGCAPVTTPSLSTGCPRPPSRFASSYAPRTAALGRGGRPTRRSASPGPPKTFAFWSPSDAHCAISTSARTATTPGGGCRSRRRSPARRASVDERAARREPRPPLQRRSMSAWDR
jgi:uncharacterized protein (TIGR03083 family)